MRLEGACCALDVCQQLGVRDDALVARLADPGVGDLFAATTIDVPIEAVVREIERAIGKPAVERSVRVVERLCRLVIPADLLQRASMPEAGEVRIGLVV